MLPTQGDPLKLLGNSRCPSRRVKTPDFAVAFRPRRAGHTSETTGRLGAATWGASGNCGRPSSARAAQPHSASLTAEDSDGGDDLVRRRGGLPRPSSAAGDASGPSAPFIRGGGPLKRTHGGRGAAAATSKAAAGAAPLSQRPGRLPGDRLRRRPASPSPPPPPFFRPQVLPQPDASAGAWGRATSAG